MIDPGRCTPPVRGIFIANLVAQMAIVVTGAVVRVTGSGLGCPTWPECVEGSYTPTARQEETWHKYVEFGNRMLTFALVVLAVAAIFAVIIDRRRRSRLSLPPRRALLILAAVPFIGTFAQAALGGVTVLTGLHPATVSAHFLVSMAIIAFCVALVARSADPGDSPVVLLVRREIRILTWGIVSVAGLVVLLGVIVTGSGPHSGDADSENRFSFDPRTVSWLHADVVLLFLGLLAALLLALRLTDAPSRVRRAAWILTGVALAQGLVGYVQYFTGLPVVAVIVHVTGAVCVWAAVLFMPFAERTRGQPTAVSG
jgi:cytochrome c oxidase assembly protein subunit 15